MIPGASSPQPEPSRMKLPVVAYQLPHTKNCRNIIAASRPIGAVPVRGAGGVGEPFAAAIAVRPGEPDRGEPRRDLRDRRAAR